VGVIVAVVIGIAVLAGIAVLLAVTERGISDEPVDRLDPGLPDGPLRSTDIPGLRFRIGLRGYRMDDVDAALARIHESLAEAEGLDLTEVSDDTLGADDAEPAVEPADSEG
jgi:DivIVA domain-containing protein